MVCLRECQSCLLGGWWGAYSVLLDALSLPACLAGQLPQLRRLLVGVLHNIPPLGLRLRVCWSLLLNALSFVADTQCSGSVGEACRACQMACLALHTCTVYKDVHECCGQTCEKASPGSSFESRRARFESRRACGPTPAAWLVPGVGSAAA